MPKRYRKMSLEEETHNKLTEVANILEKTRPDAIKSLVDSFLLKVHTQEEIKTVLEGETRERR